jgi:hypothetical protein
MKTKKIKMRISYEPNRLANFFLSDAYEKLILPIKDKKNINEKSNFYVYEKIINNLKGILK